MTERARMVQVWGFCKLIGLSKYSKNCRHPANRTAENLGMRIPIEMIRLASQGKIVKHNRFPVSYQAKHHGIDRLVYASCDSDWEISRSVQWWQRYSGGCLDLLVVDTFEFHLTRLRK